MAAFSSSIAEHGLVMRLEMNQESSFSYFVFCCSPRWGLAFIGGGGGWGVIGGDGDTGDKDEL